MHEAEAPRVEIALLGRNGGVLYTSKAAARPPHSQFWRWKGAHPGGNADNHERKGLAGKAICKTMKTKGEQIALEDRL
jgi:hypothetical protein